VVNVSHSRCVTRDRSRRESNPHLRFSNPPFYPLNYGYRFRGQISDITGQISNLIVESTSNWLGSFNSSKPMKTPIRILLTLLFFAVLTPCFATDIVRIPPQYKKDTLAAPAPEYPIQAQH